MKKLLKPFVFLLLFIVTLFAGLALFVSAIDADKYRPELASMLSEKAGRAIKLNGPIAFSLGLKGIRVSVEEASLANPDGASRPFMASIGKLDIGIDALPLLSRRLLINDLSVENADILLEADVKGSPNWALNAPAPQESKGEKVSASAPSHGAALKIGNLKIVNSQIALINAEGKRNGLNISSLTLTSQGGGMNAVLVGDIRGVPVSAEIKTDIEDVLNLNSFSIDADASYNVVHMSFSGKTDLGQRKADFSSYKISAGKTKISGKLSASWGGARPVLKGTLDADTLDPADFKAAALISDGSGNASSAPRSADSLASTRFFSDDPLPLEALRALDADLSASIGKYSINKGSLNKIKARLLLSGGRLVLDPLKASIGSTPVDVRVALDASKSPARADLGLAAKNVDLGELQKIAGMLPFMKGRASADVRLAGNGDTPHAIAASFTGVIVVTAEKGEIFTGTLADVSSLLGSVFGLGGHDSAMNCLAARFIAKGGVLNDNGILIDSAVTTILGSGSVNLGTENINILLLTKSKGLDIGGLIPSLKVKGTLKKPDYSVKATDVVKNVVGSLAEGNINVISSNVPDIQTPPAGQNACVYTLDHPQKKSTTPAVLPANVVDRAAQSLESVQDIGSSLLNGLFGQ